MLIDRLDADPGGPGAGLGGTGLPVFRSVLLSGTTDSQMALVWD
jgi:hypothetical protein